ncbi:MAG: hypothetical protein ACFB9M_11360 [Myxococcota bacterium]
MSYETYRFLHLVGMFVLAASLGGLVALAQSGVTSGFRRVLVASNGLALLVMLVAGFGMQAKLQIGMPGWIWAKVVVWLLIGFMIVPIRRVPGQAGLWYASTMLLGAVAVWLGLYKPF